ncbi:MAG TPA: pyridoxal phosphate-dependent aminotransferase [Patescibacteria group bacterium]|nr:pyridoxal phosphate-dependent aminotransferase [Patescibacteria group bacterium]
MFADRTNWNLAPNRLSVALDARRKSGHPVLDLTASNPTTCGFEYDRAAILRALDDPAALTYSPDPRGLASARRAVAAYYAQLGAAVTADNLFLATSTSEAYSWVFRTLCNPGDAVLVPAPSYPLFGFLAGLADVRPVRYPLVYDHGWQIDFHALQQALTPAARAVVVVHPNNPTGHYSQPGEAQRLCELCSSRGMALIADEVFFDFALGEKPALPPRTFAGTSAALTFTLSGLSKICGLPQMKSSWLAVSGPQPLVAQAAARLEVIADTFLSPSTPVQLALPALLALRSDFQRQVHQRLERNLAELDRLLAGHQTCSRLKVEGGWYAVIRVPATRSDDELAVELLTTHGVYIHPGHFYDFPSDGYVVASLLTPEHDFAEGVRLLLAVR